MSMNIPKISLTCGTLSDTRICELKLHPLRRRIGVLVSGGLDSALLYFLLRKIVITPYSIQPYTISRNDGSELYAQSVIDCVNFLLKKENQQTRIIPITETDSNLQVSSGLSILAKQTNINAIYVGIIEVLPEHSVGYKIYRPTDTDKTYYPFKNLNKSHIVDLVRKLNATELFNVTHSCVYKNGKCGNCNRCIERKWAFEKIGIPDSGII